MVAGTETLSYFLFPHLTLSDNALRDLCIFLPRLNVLEIARQASIPQWAQERLSGWPVSPGDDLSAGIDSCIKGYLNFAQVHGGPGGILGFLSRVFDETDEPRYSIQEELRGKRPKDMDPAQKKTTQAAVFLEIARELDEKELELESSYAHLNEIEQEFRDIVGIDDEDSSAQANLSPALAHDVNGLLFMLRTRISNWFRMFSLKPADGLPVFVACLPEVIEETLEMIRVECERGGKEFCAATYSLGSIPGAGGLGLKQFQTLIEAPGMPELLSGCHRELEDFIKRVAGRESQAELQCRSRSLQSALEKLCGKCNMPEGDKVSLGLTLVENVSFADVAGFLGVPGGFEAATWPPIFLSIAAR